MRILVVFYSRTGNIRRVAEAIAERLKADMEEIRDARSRSGMLGFLRSGYEALAGKLPKIQQVSRSPSEYDLVLIGSPVWVGKLSSPMRSYLALYGRSIKQTAFFCTCKSDEGRAFKEMEALSKKPIATLCIREKEIKSGEYIRKIEEFIKSLT
ncbi:MAG: NAD(P)H-dependent oxidoreductase [Aigarchaeota archaeon]|nr:NAD(P)H-dependent oxidoreductase [Candidatus Wolframiiraptor gerlachensis]